MRGAAEQRGEPQPTNPFDDPDGAYLVLVNELGQHSLWPSGTPTPAGWRVTRHQDSRQACLDYVAEHWRDLRPSRGGPAVFSG